MGMLARSAFRTRPESIFNIHHKSQNFCGCVASPCLVCAFAMFITFFEIPCTHPLPSVGDFGNLIIFNTFFSNSIRSASIRLHPWEHLMGREGTSGPCGAPEVLCAQKQEALVRLIQTGCAGLAPPSPSAWRGEGGCLKGE